MRVRFGPVFVAVLIFGGLVAMTLSSPSFGGLDQLLIILGGAVAIILIAATAIVLAIGREIPEEEYRRLSKRSEELARLGEPGGEPSEFDQLVIEALDELPDEFQKVLAETPVLVSDQGQENQAYGMYIGSTIARGGYPDRIVIYRDTLERDFGNYPALLREQVTRTVRHEIAHHLGWGEQGVRDLGL